MESVSGAYGGRLTEKECYILYRVRSKGKIMRSLGSGFARAKPVPACLPSAYCSGYSPASCL